MLELVRIHLALSSGRLLVCFLVIFGGGNGNFSLAVVIGPQQALNVPRNRSDHVAGAQSADHHKHAKRAHPEKPSDWREERIIIRTPLFGNIYMHVYDFISHQQH